MIINTRIMLLSLNFKFLPPANEVWGKVIFLHQFVILFTGGGMRGCWGGMCGFIRGGVRGFIWGACVVIFRGGHAWFYLGGHAWFYSGGHAWFYSGGVRGFFSFFGYNEIRSMSGRYASYWNAFLFSLTLLVITPNFGITSVY